MKYRTVIEIISDDVDADNALYTAGEYLRGNIDCGVEMKSHTVSFNHYILRKLCVSGVILAFLATIFFSTQGLCKIVF